MNDTCHATYLIRIAPTRSWPSCWTVLTLALLSLGLGTAREVDFHVTTAQDLQNALTLAAANGASNNIFLAGGYYIGNFNFNSTGGHNITIANEPNLTTTRRS